MLRYLNISADLALSDLVDEWIMSLCHALMIAAVIGPLLVVLGLRIGTVDSIRADILDDPDNRRIVPSVNANYSADWFETWAADPDIGFLAPQIHFLSASQDVLSEDEAGDVQIRRLRFLASGPGDPLMPETVADIAETEIVISRSAAEALAVSPGDTVRILMPLPNGADDRPEDIELTVTGIVPRETWSVDGGLVDEATLTRIWLESLVAGESPDSGAAPEELVYPSFRLYATTLDTLEPLAERLNLAGYPVRANFAEARRIRLIDQGLGSIFFAIAIVGVIGLTAALAANLWANVARKRAVLSEIHASGLPSWACAAFPVVQSVLLAWFGASLAFGVYLIAAGLLNDRMAPLTGIDQPCRLDASHVLMAFGWLTLLSLLSSVFAARSLLSIDPARGIQNG